MTRSEQLNEIAAQVQQWLDWQERERLAEGIPCNDDTHMMRVPVWPTRRQLKAWVSVLKTPNDLGNRRAAFGASELTDELAGND